MSGDVSRLVPKVVITHVRIKARLVSSPVALVHLGVGGTCSFERSQSQRRMACLAEVGR